jgi:hypothetical protein
MISKPLSSYKMGSISSNLPRERPTRLVELTVPFAVAKYEALFSEPVGSAEPAGGVEATGGAKALALAVFHPVPAR